MGQEHLRNLALIPHSAVTAILSLMLACGNRQHLCTSGAFMTVWRVCSDVMILTCCSSPALITVMRNSCVILLIRPLPVYVKNRFTDPQDSQLISRLITEYPAPFWVGMEYRFMPPVAALIEKAEEFCGGISMLSVTEHRFPFLPKLETGTGLTAIQAEHLLKKCCHFFDLMRHIHKLRLCG